MFRILLGLRVTKLGQLFSERKRFGFENKRVLEANLKKLDCVTFKGIKCWIADRVILTVFLSGDKSQIKIVMVHLTLQFA